MFESFPKIRCNEPLNKHCWYGLGGPADYFVEIKHIEEIAPLIVEAKRHNLSYFILGGGSNTVFHDEGFRGLVIKVTAGTLSFQEADGAKKSQKHIGMITADAGVLTTDLVREAIDRGLTGLEGLYGLPGTVGGAVFGNVGAHGVEIGTYVKNVTLLDLEGNLKEVDKAYMDFAYRYSKLHETGEIVLKVTLKLKVAHGAPASLRIEAENALNFRREKQPAGRNNGSFFKNPPRDCAGRLIDAAGLKGAKIGGAYISGKHGNFFMNDGKATTQDLIDLKNLAEKTVMEKFGILLEPEVRIVMPNGTYLNTEKT